MIVLLYIAAAIFIYQIGRYVGSNESRKIKSTPIGTKVESTGFADGYKIVYDRPIFDEIKNCRFKVVFEVTK